MRLAAFGPDTPQPLPAITNGLIRWWPNVVDGRDEVSGGEGKIVGLLRPGHVEFKVGVSAHDPPGRQIEVGAGLTNANCTVAFWMWALPTYPRRFLMEQGDGADRGWRITYDQSSTHFLITLRVWGRTSMEKTIFIPRADWQHVAFTVSEGKRIRLYHGGVEKADMTLEDGEWPPSGPWVLGSNLTGDSRALANMHDVVAYDRILTGAEIKSLAQGPPLRPVRDTRTVREAMGRLIPLSPHEMPVVVQEKLFQERRYTTDDGLPGNEVRAVLQSSDGYVWVGTQTGFARFDGSHFVAFTPENTQALREADPKIRSIVEDSVGNLWLGTLRGIVRVRNGEVKAFTNNLSGLYVLRIEPAHQGGLWLACVSNKKVPRGACTIFHYMPETGELVPRTRASQLVYEMWDSGKDLWLVTPSDLQRWDLSSEFPATLATLRDGQMEGPLVKQSLGEEVTAPWYHILESNRSIFMVELKETGLRQPLLFWLSKDRIWKSGWRFGSDGEWIGSDFGLLQKTGSGWRRIVSGNGSSPPEVTCTAANREGGVWFGTQNDDGLHLLLPKEAYTISTTNVLPRAEVLAVSMVGNESILASTKGGVVRFDTNGVKTLLKFPGTFLGRVSERYFMSLDSFGNARSIQFFSDDGVQTIHCSMPDSMGLSGGQGVIAQLNGPAWWLFPGHVIELRQDWIQKAMVGPFWPNVRPLDLPPEAFQMHKLEGEEFSNLALRGGIATANGTLWIGTDQNKIVVHEKGSFRLFASQEPLVGQSCMPRLEDSKGRIWMVSTEGLYCWDGQRLHRFTTLNGLRENLVLDMVMDPGGNIWLAGAKGIHRVTGVTLEECLKGQGQELEVLTIGSSEGMQSPQCTREGWPKLALTARGVLWAATVSGLVAVDTTQVQTNRATPKIVLNEVFTAKGPLIELAQAHDPSRGQAEFRSGMKALSAAEVPPDAPRAVRFQFAPLSFSTRKTHSLRYRLLGHDTTWSPAADIRHASYGELKPGEYVFQVQAANRYGKWSDEVTLFRLNVQPKFSETRTFQLCVVACLSSTVILIAIGLLQREQRKGIVREELRVNTEKARIASDMHDELGAGLTELSLFQGDVKVVRERARELLRVLDEIVWTINPRKDTLEATVNYLGITTQEQLEHSGIALEMDLPMELPKITVNSQWRHDVLRCVKEALRNTIRHAQAKQVKLKLTLNSNNVMVMIQDDGIGFPKGWGGKVRETSQETRGGNGIPNMLMRATRMGGMMNIHAHSKSGTLITFQFPLSFTCYE